MTGGDEVREAEDVTREHSQLLKRGNTILFDNKMGRLEGEAKRFGVFFFYLVGTASLCQEKFKLFHLNNRRRNRTINIFPVYRTIRKTDNSVKFVSRLLQGDMSS